MWRVELRRKAVGEVGIGTITRQSVGEFPTRAQAVEFVEDYIKNFDRQGEGENGEQDYWWCRKEGDEQNLVLRVVAAGD